MTGGQERDRQEHERALARFGGKRPAGRNFPPPREGKSLRLGGANVKLPMGVRMAQGEWIL